MGEAEHDDGWRPEDDESWTPGEEEETEDDDEEAEDDLDEAIDTLDQLIDIIGEIGPANTIHTVGKYLEGLGKPYAKLAEQTLALAERCARRHNVIVEVRERRNNNEGEVHDGEANNPTG